MGCLNSNAKFNHWFGNIHLSGPCNRKCYFCIGQHMMALDPLNNLNVWPLKNINCFVKKCLARNIQEIYVTGSNTDPLLYRHTAELRRYIKSKIPYALLGVRTNGVLITKRPKIWKLYDKASITICSFDEKIYKKMMGKNGVPDLKKILSLSNNLQDIKINIVLGPENALNNDVFNTLDHLSGLGIKRVNLREPYGQPRIGNPFLSNNINPIGEKLGMPFYDWKGVNVTYWDVHYVEVESVNLYANGIVSETYPITKGHCPKTGKVLPQNHFPGGRIQKQWLSYKCK